MRLALKKFSVYSKLTLLVAVAVAVAAVLLKNRGNTVSVWFFGLVNDRAPVNVVWVMLWSAVAALVAWWSIKMSIRLVREMRSLKREQELKEREDALAAKSQEVQERERHLAEQARRLSADRPADAKEKQM